MDSVPSGIRKKLVSPFFSLYSRDKRIITEPDRLISTEGTAVLVGKSNLTNSVAFDYVPRNNQTFGNRTQSNSNRSFDFDLVR